MQKSPSFMFDRVLNRPLCYTDQKVSTCVRSSDILIVKYFRLLFYKGKKCLAIPFGVNDSTFKVTTFVTINILVLVTKINPHEKASFNFYCHWNLNWLLFTLFSSLTMIGLWISTSNPIPSSAINDKLDEW